MKTKNDNKPKLFAIISKHVVEVFSSLKHSSTLCFCRKSIGCSTATYSEDKTELSMLISCVDPTGKCTLMQKDQRPGLQVFNQMDFLHRTESDPSKPNPFLSKLSTTPGKSEKDQLLPEIDPIKHCYGHN